MSFHPLVPFHLPVLLFQPTNTWTLTDFLSPTATHPFVYLASFCLSPLFSRPLSLAVEYSPPLVDPFPLSRQCNDVVIDPFPMRVQIR